jgi:hypothetical protein
MALSKTPTDFSPNNIKQATPSRYIDLNAYLNEVSMPDNRSALVHAFGSEDLTGFLRLTNAITSVGDANEVTWWEKTRLHPVQEVSIAATAATAATRTFTAKSGSLVNVRVNDVVIIHDGETRAFVNAISATGFTVAAFDGSLPAIAATGDFTFKIVGNTYAQGTEQPTEFFESNVNKFTNGFNIIKEIYRVTGSEATNISWVTMPNGDKRWFLQSQLDTNQRFKNYIETMLLLSEKVASSTTANTFNNTGSEGYFSAIESRGIVSPKIDKTNQLADIDAIIDEQDNQGGISDEYAMFLARAQSLEISDLLAAGLASSLNNGLPSQFGTFNNSEDMAVKLGFKSFSRGGRTFHMKDWKLLNEVTMLKGTKFKGVIVPTGMQLDVNTGKYAPSLEMNYKSKAGENRLMKSWDTGSVLGARNATLDAVQFNYLAEVNLVTRAANQHTLIKY